MRRWTVLRWLLIILTSCSLVFCGLYLWMQRGARPEATPTVVEENRMAPLFSLRTTRGDELGLLQYRGQPVVVNFWATWSVPCREEMVAFQKAYEHYASQGMVLLTVHHKGRITDVAKFGQDLSLTFPLLLDLDGAVTERYGVTSFPTTIFIDPTGKVRQVNIGAMDQNQIEAGIQRILTPIEPTPTPAPVLEISPTPTSTVTLPETVEGCVNTSVLNARLGPGRTFPVEKGFVRGTCLVFDARSEDTQWIRIARLKAADGSRLWVSREYIELKAGLDLLPLGK